MIFDEEYQRYLRGECKNYNQSLIGALGSMKKGEEMTMIYNDDQREDPGAAKRPMSNYLAEWIARRITKLENKVCEKEGVKMKYDDDQCEECGAAKRPGSRLCVGCMVRMITRLENRIANKIEDVEDLKEKNKKLTALCERLLDHITSQVIYATELDGYKGGLERKLREVMADEKDRIFGDK